MRALSVVVLLAACVALSSAFPSSFIEIVTYSSVGCNNTATASAAVVYALDECYTLTATTSAKYSISSGGVSSSGLVYTTFTGTVCAGTGTNVPFSSTVSGSGVTCINSGLTGSTQYTVPSTRASSVYGITYYSDDSCMTASTAIYPNPKYSLAGICSGTSASAFSGSTLQFCSYASSNCGGNADCTDVPNGQCATTSSGATYHSAQYSYNASPRTTAASTVGVGMLAAVVALVTRHL